MDMDTAYSIGLIGGDGCIMTNDKHGEYSVHIVDECLRFHAEKISPLLWRLFGLRASISPMKTRWGGTTYRSRLRRKAVVEFYLGFGIPSGKDKTYEMRTPKEILGAGPSIQSAYLRGWMDAEGCVTTHTVKRPKRIYKYPKITFQIANKLMRDELSGILERLGLHHSLWRHKQMYGFQIVGKENVFRYFEKVGFEHPDKSTWLGPNAAYNGWNNGLLLREEALIP